MIEMQSNKTMKKWLLVEGKIIKTKWSIITNPLFLKFWICRKSE